MLVVGISIAGLGGIPHNLIRILLIAADKGTTARGSNHFIAVERKHAILAKRTQHLTIKARAHTLCRIFISFCGNKDMNVTSRYVGMNTYAKVFDPVWVVAPITGAWPGDRFGRAFGGGGGSGGRF